MRCLYCGKELALLKRLTGGGEFCSEAHKRSYQEEYNRIALTRLLQAQTKSGQNAPSKDKAPPAVTVAVEEPVEEAVAVEEKQEDKLQEVQLEEVQLEEEVHAEPVESAGFILEQPAISVPADATPYVEPWLDLASALSVPAWLYSGSGNSDLPTAGLLALDGRLQFRDTERRIHTVDVQEVNVTPKEFAATSERPPVPFSMTRTTAQNALQIAGPITLRIRPQVVSISVQESFGVLTSVPSGPEYLGSALLGVFPSTIEFPAEDAEVAVITPSIGVVEVEPADVAPADGDQPVGQEASEPTPEPTPNAALDALAKVHLNPAVEEISVEADAAVEAEAAVEVEPESAPAEVDAAPADAIAAVPDATPVDVASIPEEASSVREEPSQESEDPSPRESTEFMAIAVKNFAPAKPVPADGGAIIRDKAALLPRLTGLPLRPKVALAPNQSAAAAKASPAKNPPPQAKEAPAIVTAPSRERDSKSAAKPAPATPPAPVKGAKVPATPRAVKVANVAPHAAPAVTPPVATKVQAVTTPAAAQAAPAPPSPAAWNPAKAAPLVDAPAAKSPAAAPAAKAAGPAQKPPAPKEAPAPAAKEPAPKEPVSTAEPETEAPAFESMQLGSSTGWGSLKLKLGIALVLLIVLCTVFLGWGTKSKGPSSAAPISADAPGPSIMVGEGGWVEGWAGDPTGAHFGRQITIYRPSLKLSDYRLEFQGQIDTNSVGWVFRAADPENYYAMKLTQVSGGLSPKLALFKYMIANGKQTQVGRVPIDLSAGPDMMLKVRLDVRGPRFSTYVQGQLVDVWTDDQLKSGGVGFLNEREERGRIKSVSIYYLNGGNK